jgi:hypothetical protein
MIEQDREDDDRLKVEKLEGILATAEDKWRFEELVRLESRLASKAAGWILMGNNRHLRARFRAP